LNFEESRKALRVWESGRGLSPEKAVGTVVKEKEEEQAKAAAYLSAKHT